MQFAILATNRAFNSELQLAALVLDFVINLGAAAAAACPLDLLPLGILRVCLCCFEGVRRKEGTGSEGTWGEQKEGLSGTTAVRQNML